MTDRPTPELPGIHLRPRSSLRVWLAARKRALALGAAGVVGLLAFLALVPLPEDEETEEIRLALAAAGQVPRWGGAVMERSSPDTLAYIEAGAESAESPSAAPSGKAVDKSAFDRALYMREHGGPEEEGERAAGGRRLRKVGVKGSPSSKASSRGVVTAMPGAPVKAAEEASAEHQEPQRQSQGAVAWLTRRGRALARAASRLVGLGAPARGGRVQGLGMPMTAVGSEDVSAQSHGVRTALAPVPQVGAPRAVGARDGAVAGGGAGASPMAGSEPGSGGGGSMGPGGSPRRGKSPAAAPACLSGLKKGDPKFRCRAATCVYGELKEGYLPLLVAGMGMHGAVPPGETAAGADLLGELIRSAGKVALEFSRRAAAMRDEVSRTRFTCARRGDCEDLENCRLFVMSSLAKAAQPMEASTLALAAAAAPCRDFPAGGRAPSDLCRSKLTEAAGRDRQAAAAIRESLEFAAANNAQCRSSDPGAQAQWDRLRSSLRTGLVPLAESVAKPYCPERFSCEPRRVDLVETGEAKLAAVAAAGEQLEGGGLPSLAPVDTAVSELGESMELLRRHDDAASVNLFNGVWRLDRALIGLDPVLADWQKAASSACVE